MFSTDSNALASNLSPCSSRARMRATSKRLRNSLLSMSCRVHSVLNGHASGADGHHDGGWAMRAAWVSTRCDRYDSMPKKANGMIRPYRNIVTASSPAAMAT